MSNGTLTQVAVGASPKQACAKSTTQVTWNQTGPQGEPGAPGEQGIQGIQGEPGTPGADGAPGAGLSFEKLAAGDQANYLIEGLGAVYIGCGPGGVPADQYLMGVGNFGENGVNSVWVDDSISGTSFPHPRRERLQLHQRQ